MLFVRVVVVCCYSLLVFVDGLCCCFVFLIVVDRCSLFICCWYVSFVDVVCL